MKYVALLDGGAGNARGWNPDGVTTVFTISDPALTDCVDICPFVNAFAYSATNFQCDVTGVDVGGFNFRVSCSSAPPDGTELYYVVENLPIEVL
jgi:hypothetical protein